MDERLEELVSQWELAIENGNEVTTADLCADCPELQTELERRVAPLRAMNELLNSDCESEVDRILKDAGRYRTTQFHAAGGLGDVFVAKDTELQRNVALKRIQQRWVANPENRRRFELEAEITGRLEHPGIVPVYGFGIDDEDEPFYAMRFVDGSTLKDAIEAFHAGPSQSGTAFDSAEFQTLLRSFLTVCQTVAYAHSRQIVHRDIKPANIMLGGFGETLLVDWGLAKPFEQVNGSEPASKSGGLEPDSANSIRPSLDGTVQGTPTYMSPEQASGKVGEIGPASDIYSLGATLYYLLTGQHAFRGKRVDLILDAVKQGEFQDPRTVRPDVPKPLEAICLKAMRTDPADRYASAKDVATDLERWLADEPVTAWQEPLAVRARRWLRRHRTFVVSTAAALVMAVIGLGILGYQESRANKLLTEKNDLLDAAFRDANRRKTEAEKQRELAREASALHGLALADRYFAGGALDRSFVLLKSCPKKYRSPEWHLLNGMHRTAQRTIPVGTKQAVAVAVSDRRKLVATADSKGRVVLLDSQNWNQVLQIPNTWRPTKVGSKPISRIVRCLDFNDDGTQLAIGCDDGRVELWQVSGKAAKQLTDRCRLKRPLMSVSIAGKQPMLLAADQDGHVSTWDLSVKSSKPLVYTGYQAQIRRDLFRWSGLPVLPIAATLTPDGRLAVSVGGNELHVWESKTGRKVTFYHPLRFDDFPAELTTDSIRLTAVAVSRDMQTLAVGDETGTVRLYSADLRKAKGTRNQRNGPFLYRAHPGTAVVSLAFDPTGRHIVSAGRDRRVVIYDASFRKQISRTLRAHVDSLSGAAFLPGGQAIVSAGSTRLDEEGEIGDAAGELKVWNMNTGHGYISHPKPQPSIASTGAYTAFIKSNRLHIVDLRTRKAVAALSVPVTKRGSKAKTSKAAKSSTRRIERIYAVSFNTRKSVIAALGTRQLFVTRWDPKTPTANWIVLPMPAKLRRMFPSPSLVVSPDGKHVAILARGSTFAKRASAIVCWNVAQRRARVMKLSGWTPTSVAFSPDSSQLFGCGHMDSRRGRVLFWKTAGGQPTRQIDGWNLAAISPDGKRIALADGRTSDVVRIEIREIQTKRVISRGRVVLRNPAGLRFSPNAIRLAIWSRGFNRYTPGAVMLLDTSTCRRLIDLPEIADSVNDVSFVDAKPGYRVVTSLGYESRIWSFTVLE